MVKEDISNPTFGVQFSSDGEALIEAFGENGNRVMFRFTDVDLMRRVAAGFNQTADNLEMLQGGGFEMFLEETGHKLSNEDSNEIWDDFGGQS